MQIGPNSALEQKVVSVGFCVFPALCMFDCIKMYKIEYMSLRASLNVRDITFEETIQDRLI